MRDDEQLRRDLTKIALASLDGRDFVLAGSGAIREHGLVDRLTHDVDLFTDNPDAAAFDDGVGSLVDELRSAGYGVDERRRAVLFATLAITAADGRTVEMDLGQDWREREPARFAVGPVLSVEDAVPASSTPSIRAARHGTTSTSTRSAYRGASPMRSSSS